MKRAIELIRVSTESQAAEDKAGIPAQRAINRTTARRHGLKIVRSIEIVDVSGALVLKSPQMQECLQLMESPEIHGVIAKEFSRLIRPENFEDFALLQVFVNTRTILYLPDGPIDLATKSGRLLGTIRAAIAGLERQEIRERMMDAKESMRREGKHPGGSATLPYGVAYSKKDGWSYTAESEKVKEAFRFFLNGAGYTEIANRLNFPRTNVRFILSNPIYTGWRLYDEKRDPSPKGYIPRPDGRQGYRTKIKRSKDEVIRVKVLPPLVTEEEFQAVQLRIELKRLKHWRVKGTKTWRYTYNGFLVCGDCKSLVYTHTNKNEFYGCKSHNPRERRKRAEQGLEPCTNRYMLRKKLEPKIDMLLSDRLLDPTFLEMLLDAYNESLQPEKAHPTVDQGAINAKLAALRNKRERVLDAFFEGVIDKGERDRRAGNVEKDIEAYQAILLESAKPPVQKRELDLEGVLSVVEPFAEWEFLARQDKRALLQHLCPEIFVYQYGIKGLTINMAAISGGRDMVSQPKTVW